VKLTVLGSGTVDPQPHRACSGYSLETGEGTLLVDLGNAALRRAVEYGLKPHLARHLFLSHLHPDHTADLVPLLFARKYAPGPWNEVGPLTVYGPPGLGSFLDAVFKAWPSIKPGPEHPELRVREIAPGGGEMSVSDTLLVEAVPVSHGDMKAYGFRFTEGGRCWAYSGDTSLCDGVKAVARDANLFVCECSCFPRGEEPLGCRKVHLSWEDVAEICRDSKPERVVLTHLYEPVMERKPNPVDSLSQALDINVSEGRDGLSFSV